ncbi:hypothetical protein SNEBB_007327, partial [Seison nebaliae]
MGKCFGCGEKITDMFVMKVGDNIEWHSKCLKCSICSTFLNEAYTCFIKNGSIYCKKDYNRFHGTSCFACGVEFTNDSLVMKNSENVKYHVDCFRCIFCHKVLCPGDEYIVTENTEIVCKNDTHLYIEQKKNNVERNDKRAHPTEDTNDSVSIKKSKLDDDDVTNREYMNQINNFQNIPGTYLSLTLEVCQNCNGFIINSNNIIKTHLNEIHSRYGYRENCYCSSPIPLPFAHFVPSSASNKHQRSDGSLLSDDDSGVCVNETNNLLLNGLVTNNLNNLSKSDTNTINETNMLNDQNEASIALLTPVSGGGDNGKSNNFTGEEDLKNFENSINESYSSEGNKSLEINTNIENEENIEEYENEIENDDEEEDSDFDNEDGDENKKNRLKNKSKNTNNKSNNNTNNNNNNRSTFNKQPMNKEKATRIRTVLNEKQLHMLRTCYAANPRPDALMKEQLVEMTGLSPRVIRVWFQNKRCKDKKKSILLKQMQDNAQKNRLGMGIPLVAHSPVRNDLVTSVDIQTFANPNVATNAHSALFSPAHAAWMAAASVAGLSGTGQFNHSTPNGFNHPQFLRNLLRPQNMSPLINPADLAAQQMLINSTKKFVTTSNPNNINNNNNNNLMNNETSTLLSMNNAEGLINDLHLITSGKQEVDVEDWKKYTEYKGGYHDKHMTIIMFWKIVEHRFNDSQRLQLLE